MSLFRPALKRSLRPGARVPDQLAIERAEVVCVAALGHDLSLDGVHSWGDGSVCLGFGDEARRVAITLRADDPSTMLWMSADQPAVQARGFDLDHLASEMQLVAAFLRGPR